MRHLKSVSLPDWVDVQIIPVNGAARRGETMKKVTDIAIHYVGNPGTTAQANRNYFAQPDTQVSAHFLVGLDGEVMVKWLNKIPGGWCIHSQNPDVRDVDVVGADASGQFTQASYDTLVRLTAWLCDTAGIGRDRVIRHYDVTGKACPLFFVEHPDTWTQFLADVAAA